MSKYLLVHFLDDIAEGVRFKSSEWPLHLTIVPPFSIDADPDDLFERILDAKDGKNEEKIPKPIDLKVSGKAMFGSRRDIPVMEVEPAPALRSLHEALVGRMDEAGAVHGDPKHIRERYRPHITVQKSGSAAPGRPIRLDSVTLVGYPAPGLREVLEHRRFGTV